MFWLLILVVIAIFAILAPKASIIAIASACIAFGGVGVCVCALLIKMSTAPNLPHDNALSTALGFAAGLSAMCAWIGIVRTISWWFREGYLPARIALEAIGAHLLTYQLFLQVAIGAVVAVFTALGVGGELDMSSSNAIVISLFSVFVFIASATFTSFFMREIIPWRKEHPTFSDSIAFALSVLLGLIAGIYAYNGKNTLLDINSIASVLYQASFGLASIGATLVGAYIALKDKFYRNDR